MNRDKLKLWIALLAVYAFGLFSGVLLDRIVSRNAPPGKIRVVVLGEVEKPGTYHLASGALLKDVVQAAGGFTVYANLSAVDLSLRLEDGMTVTIPARDSTNAGDVGPGGLRTDGVQVPDSQGGAEAFRKTEHSESKSARSGRLVNINTASAEELETLPGIGPKLAQEIIKYRETYGPFKKKEDLKKVKGIGDAKFAALANQITL